MWSASEFVAAYRQELTNTAAAFCRVDCPAFQIPAELVVKHEELIFAALAAMQPAAELQDALSRCSHSMDCSETDRQQKCTALSLSGA